ncbi:hypothetical protein LOC68_09295 [Blastopirellula sp. JC732]|uniref:Uncharacterized protein n=1 Tax=Blastopirellula sediminis TaxID=2894196 RepID=A0A9X1ML45_9BACT|nr:hypothetical protein [Blastopirellula sediminis]MCC9608632.1 hypothetical protein [Blastopirellula sediminis]MCC9628591.1 hypothetical protein [Blastopirellula sediminis]
MLATVAGAILCAIIVAGRNHYFAERLQAWSALADVRGISNVELRSRVDVMEEVDGVSFAIEGRPDSVVEIGSLGEYENSGRFPVRRIGKWTFRVSGRRHMGAHAKATGEPLEANYFGSHIGLGPDNPYNALVPFELNTLQDVVDHYEEIVELLETWPRESAPGTVTLEDGSIQHYYVIEDPGSENSNSGQ